MRLISFDIDGTMEFGDPPGPIPVGWVRAAQADGFLVGSASDRTVTGQRKLWEDAGIKLDFVVLKHTIDQLKGRFGADEYWHVGDTEMDRHFATHAGFTFFWAAGFTEKEFGRDGHVPQGS